MDNKKRDYSEMFKSLEESKKQNEYTWEVVSQTAILSPEIEKLKQIIADTEQYAFSVLTTT